MFSFQLLSSAAGSSMVMKSDVTFYAFVCCTSDVWAIEVGSRTMAGYPINQRLTFLMP
jgi:hypothetical protein